MEFAHSILELKGTNKQTTPLCDLQVKNRRYGDFIYFKAFNFDIIDASYFYKNNSEVKPTNFFPRTEKN